MKMALTGNKVYPAVELTEINCGECGGTYAINERFRKQKQNNGGGWNCPYCEISWGYFGKTEAQCLKEQLEAEKRGKELAQRQARAARNQTRAYKGQITKIKKRVHNGVCPCCNRHFQNLENHMKNKHPDYVDKT